MKMNKIKIIKMKKIMKLTKKIQIIITILIKNQKIKIRIVLFKIKMIIKMIKIIKINNKIQLKVIKIMFKIKIR